MFQFRRLTLPATLLAVSMFPIAELWAASGNKVTQSFDAVVTCTTTGQKCNPPQYIDLFVDSVKRDVDFKFKLGSLACSSAKFRVTVDNKKAGSSKFLGYPGVKGPRGTEAINLGVLAPGHHLVAVYAEGKTGGCNSGLLGSWGGTFKLTGKKSQSAKARKAFTGVIPAEARAVTL